MTYFTYHRDYTIQGGSISLFIYSDRLEITSHGTLPIGVTLDDLKRTHESQPRNERITYAMSKLGIIESVGTGTQEMIKECKAIGKPEPEYIERGNTFVVCFKTSIFKLKINTTMRHSIILQCLKNHPGLSGAEIQKKIDIHIPGRTLRRDLNILMNQGCIRLEGKGSAAVWFLNSSEEN